MFRAYSNHQYVRLDTLSATNKKIISAYKKLPTSLVWGNNQMASRYTTPQRSLYSRSNPKHFGRGYGITFYNFHSFFKKLATIFSLFYFIIVTYLKYTLHMIQNLNSLRLS
nr:Tn3 family transposase [Enterococcus ratti]